MEKTRIKSKGSAKLSAAERRRLIIEAAVPLFASDGFRGVTTKMLAEKAGVSEALLYRYFPSKEALYAEVQDQFCRSPEAATNAVMALTPSTATLVASLFLMATLVVDHGRVGERESIVGRLVVNSIMEDGAFARLLVQRNAGRMIGCMAQSYAAAAAAGDLEVSVAPEDLSLWFCHHMLMHMHIFLAPTPPIVAYPDDRAVLVDHAMRFMMRGIGLTASAIARHYDYPKLAATVSEWLASDARGTPS